MKVAVINFSGNTGKTTVAKHLLLPRIKDARLITVESINSDEGEGEAVRGIQFGALQEQLFSIDAAVIDVGSSNVEDFMTLMRKYRGSHEDVDFFVVPTVKDAKQIKDTIATIQALGAMGVPPKNIRLVFNRLEAKETVEDAFYPLIAFHEDSKAFTLRLKAAIEFSELYQRLQLLGTGIAELLADKTDYKAVLRAEKSQEKKAHLASMISARRLAASAQENLDEVFAVLTAVK